MNVLSSAMTNLMRSRRIQLQSMPDTPSIPFLSYPRFFASFYSCCHILVFTDFIHVKDISDSWLRVVLLALWPRYPPLIFVAHVSFQQYFFVSALLSSPLPSPMHTQL